MKVKIEPRKASDRGGYVCMMMKKNVPEGRKDWKLVKCPECGRECWRTSMIDLVEAQGAVAVCTECAIRKGIR